MTEDLKLFEGEDMKHRMDPKLVSPLVVYLASDLAKGTTGRTFFVGGGTLAEMKMVRSAGVTKQENGGLWSAEEIAARIHEIVS